MVTSRTRSLASSDRIMAVGSDYTLSLLNAASPHSCPQPDLAAENIPSAAAFPNPRKTVVSNPPVSRCTPAIPRYKPPTIGHSLCAARFSTSAVCSSRFILAARNQVQRSERLKIADPRRPRRHRLFRSWALGDVRSTDPSPRADRQCAGTNVERPQQVDTGCSAIDR